MINFFRKTRKKLADDNKFLKYSRYAIGEIVLVVIGILIALQLNNWNKEFQNKSLEKTTLENLIIDLKIQKEIIDDQIRTEKNHLDHLDSCDILINSSNHGIELIKLLDSLSERKTFIANKVTFENMGLNGNLIVITNLSLQTAAVQYYQQLDYTTSVINNNNLFRTNSQFGMFVVNNSLGFRLDKNNKPDINYSLSPEKRFTLRMQLDGRRYTSKNNLSKCYLQLISTEKLIRLIDAELNK